MSALSLHSPIRRRRLSLTPMIDVVFLLLVFFMLAARFGLESGIALSPAGATAEYSGAPRLVEIGETGIRLNGRPMTTEALPEALSDLMADPADAVLIRADEGLPLQSLIDLLATLESAGLTTLVLVE